MPRASQGRLSGNVEICREQNGQSEEYDDWYDNSDEEFYYEDSSGICDMLEEACDFVHVCMDMERYKEGFELSSGAVKQQ